MIGLLGIDVDYREVCRLCLKSLKQTQLKIHMFEDAGFGRNLIGKVVSCLSLMVSEADSLPKYICYSCVDKLENFTEFRETCHKSESILNTYVATCESHPDASHEKTNQADSTPSAQMKTEDSSAIAQVKVESAARAQLQQNCVVEDNSQTSAISPTPDSVNNKSEISAMRKSTLKEPPMLSGPFGIPDFARTVSVANSLSADSGQDVTVRYAGSRSEHDFSNWDNTAACSTTDKSSENHVTSSVGISGFQDAGVKMERRDDMVDLTDSDEEAENSADYIVEDVRDNRSHVGPNDERGAKKRKNTPNKNEDVQSKHHARFIPEEVGGHNKHSQHVCFLCNMTLATELQLSHHVTTHFNPDKNVCNICGRCFGYRYGLQRHMKIHKGVRDYVCPVCGKSFMYKDKLERHGLIHSGAKPFSCDVCGKSFNRKDKRNAHALTHALEVMH